GIVSLRAPREPQVVETRRARKAVVVVARRNLAWLYLEERDAEHRTIRQIERHAAVAAHMADAGDQHAARALPCQHLGHARVACACSRASCRRWCSALSCVSPRSTWRTCAARSSSSSAAT